MIYFVQSVEGGPIKIGFSSSNCCLERLASLQVGSPLTLRLLGVMEGDRGLEHVFHERLWRHRVHGEWFKPAPVLLKSIADNCGDRTDVVAAEIVRLLAAFSGLPPPQRIAILQAAECLASRGSGSKRLLPEVHLGDSPEERQLLTEEIQWRQAQ